MPTNYQVTVTSVVKLFIHHYFHVLAKAFRLKAALIVLIRQLMTFFLLRKPVDTSELALTGSYKKN